MVKHGPAQHQNDHSHRGYPRSRDGDPKASGKQPDIAPIDYPDEKTYGENTDESGPQRPLTHEPETSRSPFVHATPRTRANFCCTSNSTIERPSSAQRSPFQISRP